MAEKRKLFRKKRFKRFENSFENCLENDSKLKTVIKEFSLRHKIWKTFIDDEDDDSDDNIEDNDFIGFDASNRIQELLQKQWKQRIRQQLETKTSSSKKSILRKARLEISSKTLQKIRRSNLIPIKEEKKKTIIKTTNSSSTTSTSLSCSSSRSGQPGFIVCAICSKTKYYSHVQRRYGVFSCEPCSKFFARFLKDPHQLFCSRDLNCQMNEQMSTTNQQTSGTRCRACWLNACLNTFQMESQLKEEIFNKFKPKLSSKSSPLSVSIATEETEDKNKNKKNSSTNRSVIRGQPLLMVATNSGPRVKRVCRRSVTAGLPRVATFGRRSPLSHHSDEDSDELPVDVYLCRAVAEGVTS